ncbi:MAG: L,D-transpeptidase family protein [Hyphomicrobiaceae bacterium]
MARVPTSLAVVLITLAAALPVPAPEARAVEVVLRDVAPDRIERQRAFAAGTLELADTPDLSRLAVRLADKGLTLGSAVFLRIFKEESELEVWMQRGDRYIHFATYPICFWSGALGPKLSEGDKQTPEGVYTVTRRQLHRSGRWPRSLNIGFPNGFDRQNQRTGSYILVHGGCSSVGCYAMTDAVVKEVFQLTSRALTGRTQRTIQVHAFPFRMTDANMARHRDSPWREFWSDLKIAHDIFERTHVPPQAGVCRKRYVFAEASARQALDMRLRSVQPARQDSRPQLARASASAGDALSCPPARGLEVHVDAETNSDTDREARHQAIDPVLFR